LPRTSSTSSTGFAATARPIAAGRVSISTPSSARFSASIAPAVSPRAIWRVIAGSSAVPAAVPITPSGSWLMRSA